MSGFFTCSFVWSNVSLSALHCAVLCCVVITVLLHYSYSSKYTFHIWIICCEVINKKTCTCSLVEMQKYRRERFYIIVSWHCWTVVLVALLGFRDYYVYKQIWNRTEQNIVSIIVKTTHSEEPFNKQKLS